MEEKNIKINDYIDQLNELCKLYNDCMGISNRIDKLLANNEGAPKCKYDISILKDISYVYLEYERNLNNTFEIIRIINEELIDTVNFIKSTVSPIVETLVSLKPYIKINSIIKDIDNKIEHLNYNYIYLKDKPRTIVIINNFLYEDINFSNNDLETIFKGFMKLRNRLVDYANSLEIPMKKDWERYR